MQTKLANPHLVGWLKPHTHTHTHTHTRVNHSQSDKIILIENTSVVAGGWAQGGGDGIVVYPRCGDGYTNLYIC